MEDDEDYDNEECLCVVFYRAKTGRLIHWHWPRLGIPTCTRAAKAVRDYTSS